MDLLSMIVSLPISLGLVFWIIRLKKEEPFPKGTVIKSLLLGALSGIVSSVIYLAYALYRVIDTVGLDTIMQAVNDPENSGMSLVEKLQAAAAQAAPATFLSVFITTFLLVGIVEEIMKFLFAKGIMKKPGTADTWFDAVLLFSLVGLGFQIWEDVGYAQSGGILTAITRALTPFHFVFAVIMGYWYGKAKVSHNGFYTFLAILVPALLHTAFDASLRMMAREDIYIIPALAVTAALFITFIAQIIKINKWHKMHKLSEKIREA